MSARPEIEDFHFANAPIMEALIEIKLTEPLVEDFLSSLKECAMQLEEVYPIREDMQAQQVQFQFGITPSGSSSSRPIGFLCKDSNAHHVVQLRLDGFAFSELKPYSSWDKFFPEARRLWNAYRLAIGGASPGSWSIRYVNQISFPEREKIEEYLNVYPALPAELPQSLMGCFIRLQSSIVDPAEGLFTQQIFLVPPQQAGKASFVIDHDFSFSAIGISDSVLWTRIQEVRRVKNSYFNVTFTERALEMFR